MTLNYQNVMEMTVVRHYTNHSENNFGVDNGFYPLGSCTMKYNPVINEEIASLKTFTSLHPLQPIDTVQGALEVEYNIQRALASITGMADVTLNPYAGAHGELTGLMIISSYHQHRRRYKTHEGYRSRLSTWYKPSFCCCMWFGSRRSKEYSRWTC